MKIAATIVVRITGMRMVVKRVIRPVYFIAVSGSSNMWWIRYARLIIAPEKNMNITVQIKTYEAGIKNPFIARRHIVNSALGIRATMKSAKKMPQKYGKLVTPTTLNIYRMPVFLCFIGSAE